jgi:HlyD family type I secretion membrane fusion protein
MTGTALIRRKTTDLDLIDKMPTAAIRIMPPTAIKRTVAWLFLLGFGVFGVLAAWAAVAPMQSAIVASGLFRVVGDRLVVQHLEGGIVRSIAVKEGDVVQRGQVLISLDDTSARASVDILTNQLVSALSTQARLQAEFEETADMRVSDELAALLATNPSFADMFQTQADVLKSNTRIARGQIEILQQRIGQLAEQKVGAELRLKAQDQQLALLRQDIVSRSALLEQGLTTKSQVLAMRRDEAGMEGNSGVTESQLQAILQQIAEVEARKLQVRRDYLKEITEGRQQVNERIFEIRQRLASAQDVVDRLTIRAPRPGRIVGLQVNTLGSVISAGQKLMELVPDDAGYVIEVRVNPNDVNQVTEGGRARVRLTGYNYRTTPMVEGAVTAVSADSLVDQATGSPYFQVDIRIKPGQLEHLDGVDILPGMPAQVMIATGEQTLANYLLSPVVGGYERALIENE